MYVTPWLELNSFVHTAHGVVAVSEVGVGDNVYAYMGKGMIGLQQVKEVTYCDQLESLVLVISAQGNVVTHTVMSRETQVAEFCDPHPSSARWSTRRALFVPVESIMSGCLLLGIALQPIPRYDHAILHNIVSYNKHPQFGGMIRFTLQSSTPIFYNGLMVRLPKGTKSERHDEQTGSHEKPNNTDSTGR